MVFLPTCETPSRTHRVRRPPVELGALEAESLLTGAKPQSVRTTTLISSHTNVRFQPARAIEHTCSGSVPSYSEYML